jgi:ABC-type multidrug transport system ATPase subunit/ABC-type multidrug transport system permease subunit
MVRTNVTEGNKAVMTDSAENDGQKTPGKTGVLLQVKELTIRPGADVSSLSDISFHIEPGELVSLTGVSYTGKSTLLQSLAGLLTPASGEILIDGVNLYANLKAFRSSIGFVPAEFSLPQNLTVAEVMEDGARLHLPRRTSNHDRKHRVKTLLGTTGLTNAIDSRVGSLSRIEKRRLSIAIELIAHPGLLLLDTPAEQLTPFEEVQITILLKELSRQGLTIIQVDQRARSAGFSDKVIFLAPGGLLACFGPPDEAFIHLRSLVPKGIAKDLFGIREALEVLGNPQVQEGVEWAKRFKADPVYQKYVDDPLHDRYPDLMLQTRPLLRLRLRNSSQEKLPPPIIPRANAVQKFLLLVRRHARLLWRDKTIFSMLAIPLLIALVDFVFAPAARSDPARAPLIFGMLVFLVLLTSALLVQNEISRERAVYRYENRTRTLMLPYILSKVWLVGLLAIYQALVWTAIHAAATGMAEGPQALLPYGTTVFLVSLIGGALGLIVSAMAKKQRTSTNWLLLLIVPQLIFSGSVIPMANIGLPFRILSSVNPSRYALDALLRISGYGDGFAAPPMSDWLALAIISLGLIALLLLIQQRAGDRKDMSS